MPFTTAAESQVIHGLKSLLPACHASTSAAAQAVELAPPRSMNHAERQIVSDLMGRLAEGKVSDNDMRDFVIRLSEVLGHETTRGEFQALQEAARLSHHQREAFAAGIRSGVGFSTISYTVSAFTHAFIHLLEGNPQWSNAEREKFASALAYVGAAAGFGVTGNLAFMVVSNWINHHQLGSFTYNSQLAHLGIEGRHLELQKKETQWRAFSLWHTAGGFVEHRYPRTPVEYATQRGWIQSPAAGVTASLWKSATGFRVDDATRLTKLREPQLRHIAAQSRHYQSESRLLGVPTGPVRAFAKELTVWTADLGRAAFESVNPARWPGWRPVFTKNGAIGTLTFAAGLSSAILLYGRSNQLSNRALVERAGGLDPGETEHAAYVWHQVANGVSLAEVFIYRGWVQNWLSRAFGVPGAGPIRAPGLTLDQAAAGLRGATGEALRPSEDPEAGGLALTRAVITAAQELACRAPVSSLGIPALASQAGAALNTPTQQLPAETERLERFMNRLQSNDATLRAAAENVLAHQGHSAEAMNQDELYAVITSLIADAREIGVMTVTWPGTERQCGELTQAIDRLEHSFSEHARTKAKQMTPANLASLAQAMTRPNTSSKNMLAGVLAASLMVGPGDRRYLGRQHVRDIMTPLLAADPAIFSPAAEGVRRIGREILGVEQLLRLGEDISRSSGNHRVKERLLQVVSDRVSPSAPEDLLVRGRVFDSTQRFWLVRPWVVHMAHLDETAQSTLVILVNDLRADPSFSLRDRQDLSGYVQDLPNDLQAKFAQTDATRLQGNEAQVAMGSETGPAA